MLIGVIKVQLMTESREIRKLEGIVGACHHSTQTPIIRTKVTTFLDQQAQSLHEHPSLNGIVTQKEWAQESFQTTDSKLCKTNPALKLENKCNLKKNLQRKINTVNMGQIRPINLTSRNSITNKLI